MKRGKMKNADMPAMPLANDATARPYIFQDGDSPRLGHAIGLTKREYFAGLAMQGLISSPEAVSYASAHDTGNPHGQPGAIAEYATACADALLAELEKTK